MGARTLPQHEPLQAEFTPRLTVVRGFGGGGPPAAPRQPPVSNAQLGVAIFIAFETMIFVGLVSAYIVLRGKSFAWPPPDLPRLPLAVTWVNSAMLVCSALTMRRAAAAIQRDDQRGMQTALVATAVLGGGFLGVQGTEWARLIRQGLTLASSTYGATFYTLIGLHALHVVGAVLWLLGVVVIAQRHGYSAERHGGLTLCAMYWYFVCALWVLLFGIVYLY
ncbi:MAG: heme-copper oxidase subunit III [Candidatus Binatia bacterium]